MLRTSFTLAISLLFFFEKTFVSAQSATPEPKVGYIRFWDMLPAASGTFLLKKGDTAADVVTTAAAYAYSSYRELPVGSYQLSIAKSGTDKALQRLNLNVKQDSFFTIIIAPQATGYKIEFVEDTVDPKTSSTTLAIRNYFPGTSVSVVAGKQTVVTDLPYGGSFPTTGLPNARVPLTITTKLPNGVTAESSAEADFVRSKHATLLIIPDSYGRFRPRVTIDGRN